ncbi:hypothetical protein C3747_2g143 [Trypanosoma cruzi]|uniref:Uncharacterized protein n=2 Tax=Trypanosoma cruzi TaxID=5693 RepID=Q4E1V6_TRYCC|nr:hypothetical protein, conserved [Trypanosoma cruzi]EAN98764.1 hypothetical protein, conserved [Trypanosoma cruzi]PWV21513.1 hypothetical protein C3747_2g143 [Trypanosoma cruzi]RNC58936.1 hypothetical protein TcCL_ESM03424 [Trypanosoma cruzi]|eukprot:XP_820615.1 hypothetical protein [Trypanosoma cruzi strain CL Brener]
MADAYRILKSSGSDTLAGLCSDQKVDLNDVWIPLQSFCSARGRMDTPVIISPATAIVLLDHPSGKLVTRRGDILARIPLLFLDERNLAIPPSAIPDGCTLFVRAAKSISKKRMVKGLSILHRPITREQAFAEGSSLALEEETKVVQKQPRKSTGSGADAVTVAGGMEAALERRKKTAKIDGLFEEYLQKALEGFRDGRLANGGVIMKETMANLLRVRDAAPLHFVMHGKSKKYIHVNGIPWFIPDWRVIYRVFRRGETVEETAKTTYTDAARLVAVFMIDNVLIRREPIHACLQEGHPMWSLIDPNLPSAAHKLAEKGYRIVLLDHYPSLHHGNEIALEAKLNPIAELCQKYFTCDVTVVLSTMSYISAAYRSDGKPFLLPYSGLWQFFITQLNGGLRADADSLLVGESVEGVDHRREDVLSQGRRDAKFAMNCSLRYVDSDSLKKEILQS